MVIVNKAPNKNEPIIPENKKPQRIAIKTPDTTVINFMFFYLLMSYNCLPANKLA